MKRVLFIPLLASLLFACSKETVNNTTPTGHEPTNQAKKPFRVSVADFIKQEEDMRSARKKDASSSLTAREDSSRISDIYYIAYNSSGTRVNFIHQDTTTAPGNFGTISDSLAPGSYTIVLIASEKPLYTDPILSNSNISAHSFGPSFIGGLGIDPLGDLFLKKIPVEISATGNPTDLEVSLNRIVGKLEVNILDALPASNANGFVRVQVTPLSVAYYIANGSLSTPESLWLWYGTRKDQHHFADYLFGSANEFNVIIEYQDKNTGETLSKTIEHVTCSTNKKTIITGYLYGTPANPGGPDYQIRLNQAWDSDSTIINF